ncbi:hypothetical protein, partial [Streptomyces sp. NPDC086010]|uniref:hypothetical protein n=1 Tax=Streptomyces sp. NPDC086010 TaxID=3365745 RepID=UPI0037D2BBAE
GRVYGLGLCHVVAGHRCIFHDQELHRTFYSPLLRVTGSLVQPHNPQVGAYFIVDGLEVLEAASACALYVLVLERFGN